MNKVEEGETKANQEHKQQQHTDNAEESSGDEGDYAAASVPKVNSANAGEDDDGDFEVVPSGNGDENGNEEENEDDIEESIEEAIAAATGRSAPSTKSRKAGEKDRKANKNAYDSDDDDQPPLPRASQSDASNGHEKVCFKCGKPGHLSKECEERRSNFSADSICFKCGQEGHDVMGCPLNVKKCFKCGKEGHLGRDCPRNGRSGDRKEGGRGGSARGGRGRGGSRSERGRDGPRGGRKGHDDKHGGKKFGNKDKSGGGNDRCFKCGETGHLLRDCPNGGKKCFNCGQQGHVGKDCPNGSSRRCFICGSEGHMNKDCPNKDQK